MLDILDMLVFYGEGRDVMVDHTMGIVVVSKRIFRAIEIETKKGVQIIWSLCIYSSNA